MANLKEKENWNKYGPVIEFNAAVDIACASNGRRQLTAFNLTVMAQKVCINQKQNVLRLATLIMNGVYFRMGFH